MTTCELFYFTPTFFWAYSLWSQSYAWHPDAIFSNWAWSHDFPDDLYKYLNERRSILGCFCTLSSFTRTPDLPYFFPFLSPEREDGRHISKRPNLSTFLSASSLKECIWYFANQMITDDSSGPGKLNSEDRNFHPWSIDESFSALYDVKDIYRSKGNNVRVFERRVKLDLDLAVVDLNVLKECTFSCIWGNLFQVYPP